MCNVCGCGSGQTLIGGHALKQVRKPGGQVQYRVHDGQTGSPRPNPDGTTDRTTSHLTKPLKRQVIGYSHSTWLASDASRVAGYPPARGRGGGA